MSRVLFRGRLVARDYPERHAQAQHGTPRDDRTSLGNAVRDGAPKGSAESQTALGHPKVVHRMRRQAHRLSRMSMCEQLNCPTIY